MSPRSRRVSWPSLVWGKTAARSNTSRAPLEPSVGACMSTAQISVFPRASGMRAKTTRLECAGLLLALIPSSINWVATHVVSPISIIHIEV
jgi:hypothetical protein